MIPAITNTSSNQVANPATFGFHRLVKSPLLMAITLLAIGAYAIPFRLACGILAFSLVGIVRYPHLLPSSLLYEVAIADLIVRAKLTQSLPSLNQNWWHTITPKLILGGIPLASHDHLHAIKKLGVKAVYSILEDFEATSTTFFSSPVLKENWTKAGVCYNRLSCQDMTAMSLKELDDAVRWLHRHIISGHTAYVHCKAGRGRSAMVVLAYLMRYQKMSLDRAIAFVSSKRAVISLRPCQYDRLREFEERLHPQFSSNIKSR